MKKSFFVAAFLALLITALCWGQNNNFQKLSRIDAANAWATAVNLPDNLPGVSGGGLVVETAPNDFGRRVWAAVSKAGSYLLLGTGCDGGETRLGEFFFEPVQGSEQGGGLVLDTQKFSEGANFLAPPCGVRMIRSERGAFEGSSNTVDPNTPDEPKFAVGSEGLKDGRYYVSLGPLPVDATVILGRWLIGEIQRSPAGAVVFFKGGLPYKGATTLTVCTGGRCTTTTYDRKVIVEYPGGGKG